MRVPGRAEALEAGLRERGVLCSTMDQDVARFVTHFDVDDAEVALVRVE